MRTVLYGSLAIATLGLVVACGDSPTTPSPFTDIQVFGPDSIVAGESVQFVANIRQADGTTKSASSLLYLRWRSSNPSVVAVSNSGVVTTTPSGAGKAVITAELTTQSAVRGTREVVVRPSVTGTLEVSQQATSGRTSYVFAVKLSELAGVARTVTELLISLDDGWSGQCSWTPAKLGQTRLPAKGILALDPLTCGFAPAFDVEVLIHVTDDAGKETWVVVRREL